MTKYDVIYSTTLAELVLEVNQELSDGWMPLGGIAIILLPDPIYYQAIIKNH